MLKQNQETQKDLEEETKINQNEEIIEQNYTPPNRNRIFSTKLINNINNMKNPGLDTEAGEKKIIFNIQNASTAISNIKNNKDNADFSIDKNYSIKKEINKIIPKKVFGINEYKKNKQNHSSNKLNQSTLNKNEKENSNQFSLSDYFITLKKNYDQLLEKQEYEMKEKEIKKILQKKRFKINEETKVPNYLKNKNENKSKFYEIGTKRIITECFKSLDNFINNKKVIIYKLYPNQQVKSSILDLKLFFNKSIYNIYIDNLPKRLPSKYKNDRESCKNEISEIIKIQISEAIEKEKKDEKEEKTILNILFNGETTFWNIFETFIYDKDKITINSKYVNIEGFSTLKDRLFLFNEEDKNELKLRIKNIRDDNI